MLTQEDRYALPSRYLDLLDRFGVLNSRELRSPLHNTRAVADP